MQTSAIISSALSGIAILVAISAFIYTNVRRGKLQFWPPSAYSLSRTKNDAGMPGNTVLAFPVSVTNTGSVVHTVNYIWGVLKGSDGITHGFRMQVEPDDIVEPTKKPPIATGFAVPPNNSVVKLISFVSDDPALQLKTGGYSFALYAWIDGRAPTIEHVSFTFNVNDKNLSSINKGGRYGELGHAYELGRSLLKIDKEED